MGRIVNKFTTAHHGESWLNCTCATCGRKFHDKPSHLVTVKNHYCSKECHKIGKKEYMKGELNHQYGLKGNKNATWKSDRKISNFGYVLVRCLDHPFSNKNNWVCEHRLIAEKYLLTEENSIMVNGKRYLSKEYDVHHINFDRSDNRIENLMVLTKKEHRTLHNKLNPNKRDKTTGRMLKRDEDIRTLRTTPTGILPRKVPASVPLYELFVDSDKEIVIEVGEIKKVVTGSTVEIPKGKVGAIYMKHGVHREEWFEPHNCLTVFDGNRHGGIEIWLQNTQSEEIKLQPKEAFAFLMLNDYLTPEIEYVVKLDATERGDQGFGSTGR